MSDRIHADATPTVRARPGSAPSPADRTEPADSAPSAGLPALLGGYRIVGVLGRGGMGAVYLAHDDRLGRAVAIKTMRPETAAVPDAAERFLREARAAARVVHDNIVAVWQVGEDAGMPFIVMPVLVGETLDQRLRRSGTLSTPELLKLGSELADALAAAHEHGLVHRDLKPANVWIEGEPASADPGVAFRRAKLLDFGLARSVDPDTRLTADGFIVGTPAYMSPEQANGRSVDHRTDLWGLGVVLYQAATGVSPFQGETLLSVLAALSLESLVPARERNPNVSQALSDLIGRLLAKDPAGRPASAAEVVAALRAMPTDAPFPPRPVRRLWPVLVAGSLGASLLALGLILATGREGGRKEGTVVAPAETSPAPQVMPTRPERPPSRPEPPPPAPEATQEEAARWVFSVGGSMRIQIRDREITARAVADLPAGNWTASGIDLKARSGVTDEGLRALRGCPRLRELDVSHTAVTDAGLKHLSAVRGLRSLVLDFTLVGDDGLRELAATPDLSRLCLNSTRVTDEGLAALRGLRELETLELVFNPLTGEGLRHLAGLAKLRMLRLTKTGVTDAGLKHLAPLKQLILLDLSVTQVSDGGMEALGELTGLQALGLSDLKGVTDRGTRPLSRLQQLGTIGLRGSGVGDGTLEVLATLPKLQSADVATTAVTPRGCDRFKAARTDCELIRE